ncbi:alpha/beta fold hydrolase [Chelatococcus asaccharovorans]|uniref:Pimeloyl-ACP methyl ester carboxylesterase n=1 Tax=Chelatococcus asaccharovorans TaxID=28210 RepID=A0A2V3TXU3_9HYPH|nr:alpha/beta fold hydrolase [Chelatococcus asaccharovorans]MBS7707474.1 alpha/beta fold hydrolase [Chelatococcus asaccharovorans]PXW54206.1 pimeloyl-ACP methyl ester carboxylesterase [Chelatococcus asaccharovorans]
MMEASDASGLYPVAKGDPFLSKSPVVPRQIPAAERLVDIETARLWCWDTGGGAAEPVVLLHAIVGSGAMWLHQQPVLAAAGYRVIGYSRRGHFGSDAGDPDDPGTGAGDLAALLDRLDIPSAHIVGTAGGGFVAADFAIAFPDRVRSLTLSTSLVAVRDRDYMAATMAMRDHAFESLPREFREVGPGYRATNPEGLAAWLALTAEGRPIAIAQHFLSALDLPALGGLRVPTLVIASDADMYAPPPVMRRIALAIPGARLGLIAGAGHSAYWEQPQAFNAMILDFLASI